MPQVVWLDLALNANIGALTPLPGSPFSTSVVLLGPTVDPAGRFLFAVDTKNKVIMEFSIDPSTGALSALGNSAPIAGPTSLSIDRAP